MPIRYLMYLLHLHQQYRVVHHLRAEEVRERR